MMTASTRAADIAVELSGALVSAGFSPFFGTPCGVLAPLYSAIDKDATVVTVPREDNAVGMAAGAAMAGGRPVVLMQNSGLGQSVNALASLISPYRIPVLLVVSLRGLYPDHTLENALMGEITEPLLAMLGLEAKRFQPGREPGGQVAELCKILDVEQRPAALTVAPDAFGWST